MVHDSATDPLEALIDRLNTADTHIQQDAAVEIIDMGEVAVPRLMEVLRAGNPRARYLAAWILGEIGDARAIDHLIAALMSDKDTRVQEWAAKSLGELGDVRAVLPLINVLQHASGDTRRNAATALGWLNDRRATPALIALLHDDEPAVRSAATEALGKIADPSAFDSLCRALKDDDAWTRIRAANALGQVRDSRAVTPLVESLSDSNEWVRYNAALSLGELNASNALAALIAVLQNDESPNARRAAAAALGRLGADSDTAIEALVAALADPEDAVIEAVDRALQRLGYTVD